MTENSLTIIDNRTGARYEIAVEDNAIRAMELRRIKTSPDDFGLITYDPGFTNTASCRSAITFIDGDRGILEYRGYPIEQIAEQGSYLETAYLLVCGSLPSRSGLEEWENAIKDRIGIHDSVRKVVESFVPDAHPMGMLLSAVGALSMFYPEAKHVGDPNARRKQVVRLIAKIPTIAALCHRHRQGLPFVPPDSAMSYAGNLLNMLFRTTEPRYKPNPAIERALDVLFILHADHEQNCSTSAMRDIGSAQSDPYSAMAGAIAALYGPLHGGANEVVVRMLQQIGSKDRVPEFMERVKKGEGRLMGFGHRVYKSYDPRARLIKQAAGEVFETTGRNPLLDVALELERIALQDDYFVSRKLYPNVDFYSGLIYQSIGLPVEMFPVMFAIARTSGWLAQWDEELRDPALKIARPRQVYTGPKRRNYVPISER